MKKLIFSILFFLALLSSGQSQTLETWTAAGDTAMANRDFFAAIRYFEILLDYDSTNMDMWYKLGNAAREFDAFDYAEKAYTKVLQNDPEPPKDLLFWLGRVNQAQSEYQEAISFFEEYIDAQQSEEAKIMGIAHNLERESASIEAAENAIKACEDAMKMESALRKKVSIRRLTDSVNTSDSEFLTDIRGNKIYYSAFRFNDNKDKHKPKRRFYKILESELGDQDTTNGRFLSEEFYASNKHTAHIAYNTDQTKVYYTLCEYVGDADIRCDLYVRLKEPTGKWGPAVKLDINSDDFTTAQPNVAAINGVEVLFFSSNRKEGGKGSMDIWYGRIKEDGQLDQVTNASAINTPGNEVTPSFHDCAQILFFSSDSQPQSFGGYDIFQTDMTSMSEDGMFFLSPKNLGYPINTSYNDLYFHLTEDGTQGYFSSNRHPVDESRSLENVAEYVDAGKKACCNDIFNYAIDVDMDVLTFNADDSTKVNGATVTLEQITDAITFDPLNNPDDNTFHFPLDNCKAYKVIGSKENYLPDSATVFLPLDPTASQTITVPLYLTPLKVRLDVFTYIECLSNGANTPLEGVTLTLSELTPSGPVVVKEDLHPNDNYFSYRQNVDLELDKTYILTATKQFFGSVADTIHISLDEAMVHGEQIAKDTFLLTRNLFLGCIDVQLTMLFDNDEPGPKNKAFNSTPINYRTAIQEYEKKKQTYINEFTAGMDATKSFIRANNMENFFEREVLDPFNFWNNSYRAILAELLKQGLQYEIVLDAYCSPLGQPAYNRALAMRRISSVENMIRQDSLLAPYLDNQLILKKPKPEEIKGEGQEGAGIEQEIVDKVKEYDRDIQLDDTVEARKKLEERGNRRFTVYGILPALMRRVTMSVRLVKPEHST